MVMEISTAAIWESLKTIPDPEIPAVSIVDLGIVRNVEFNDDQLKITITPTYSGCPAFSFMKEEIIRHLESAGIFNYQIDTSLAPPWTTDWMSQRGREKLEKYGIAPPQPAGGPDKCPNCASSNVEKLSQFGSTPCKAQWRCKDCLEPFDYFKCI